MVVMEEIINWQDEYDPTIVREGKDRLKGMNLRES